MLKNIPPAESRATLPWFDGQVANLLRSSPKGRLLPALLIAELIASSSAHLLIMRIKVYEFPSHAHQVAAAAFTLFSMTLVSSSRSRVFSKLFTSDCSAFSPGKLLISNLAQETQVAFIAIQPAQLHIADSQIHLVNTTRERGGITGKDLLEVGLDMLPGVLHPSSMIIISCQPGQGFGF